MSDRGLIVICDAGPLIHLDELHCLHLLDDFDRILVPKQVLQEVQSHRPTILVDSGIQLQQVNVAIAASPPFQALVRTFSLDLGEQAALSLMQDYPQAILLTDDAAARLAASSLGYNIHGTIGVLIRSIRRNQLNKIEVIDLLHRLPMKSTLHIRPELLQEIIATLEQAA
jgi:predicted nucleic acid-binding protein